MKKITLFIMLVAGMTLSFKSDYSSSDCNPYFPLNKGTTWVTNNYNPKGKLQSSTKVEVVGIENTASGTAYTLTAEPVDDKKDTSSVTFTYTCDGDVLRVDMNKMLPKETMDAIKEGMEIEIDQDELVFPSSSMSVGEKLDDANITLRVKSNGFKILEVNVKIYDRVVEKEESITTDAGTFNCLKLNYKTTVTMGFLKQNSSTTEWLSKSTGMIRSEFYDKKGKLSSYSELAKFKP